MFLRIALPMAQCGLFDYLPCKGVSFDTPLGIRLVVPYRYSQRIGILVEINKTSTYPIEKLKCATRLIDDTPLIDPHILKLCRQIATYYHRSLGEVLTMATPSRWYPKTPCKIQHHDYWQLTPDHDSISMARHASRQKVILDYLKKAQQPIASTTLNKNTGANTTLLRKLEQKGVLHKTVQPYLNIEPLPHPILHSEHTDTPLLKNTPLTLNQEQQHALKKITQHYHQFAPTVLYGVTGSGKTEVYLQSIAMALKQKKQALVLVPEIGLTPQTLQRFKQRFTIPIIVWHSNLNTNQRAQRWWQARHTTPCIVIGTRSSIFIPLPHLGIIVIDEAHDSSYKQQDTIRYSARDVAMFRGKHHAIPVILGSATPALESLAKAWSGKYHYLTLNQRAGSAHMPTLSLIDMRKSAAYTGLSTHVINIIRQNLAAQRQILIFINRRGFAPTLMCTQCGYALHCVQCDAHTVLHRFPPQLQCHHCGTQYPIPTECPKCCAASLVAVGAGTERTEHALQTLFPKTNILRIDRDSTRKKGSWTTLLNTIHSGQSAILVGTQMIAKGHHFPNVTHAVIVNIDAGLFSADFRGEEKMAQLLLQVAGRTGRDKTPGTVLIQTYHPDNKQLLTLIKQGYINFARTQLAQRKNSDLPPFTYLALLGVESINLTHARDVAYQVKKLTRQYPHTALHAIGPLPAHIAKKKGQFSWHLLFRANQRSVLHHFLTWLQPHLNQLPRKNKLRWFLDIDPIDGL